MPPQVLGQSSECMKEVIWLGSSGFSPAFGGILNPPACGSSNPNTDAVLRTGDLCVTPFAINW